MMKKTTLAKYAVMAGLALSITACDDWLDNQPKGLMIPQTVDDYQLLLNGQYLYTFSDIYHMFLTDDVLLTGRGDIPNYSNFEYNSKSEEVRNCYSFVNGDIFLPSASDPVWNNGYDHIFTYNAIINNVLTASGSTESERKRIWGEALVGRSFEYLRLVNLYGKHYDPATADSDYGVPLVLSEEITGEQYPRASVAEVYSQIQQDLEQAVPCLSERTNHSFAPSKEVSYAFLARMFLYMGNYEQALENANNALKLNDYLLDYNLYTTTYGTWGRIISKDNDDELFPEDNDNQENIYTRIFTGTSYIFATVAASEDLLATFKEDLPTDAIDKRLDLFYETDSCNRTANAGSAQYFRGYTTYMPYINLNVGFSTPEIYLIAAECEARVGDKNKALEHLNTLRDKRIENNVHFATPTSLSNEEVLRLVLNERRREFAFIGTTRLIDLKRLNKESQFAKTITHSAGSEGTWTLPPNDPRYIIPVPETVTSFNPMPEYER